ncbi:hypothetical protein [Crocosphaera chwakensis]|uniref:Uncharacterized protein n=1 Tax=Crocosphaera chwakensis CCY0110 TaxID=391612 RepID=A3INN6_9CHRO|nr:hypothetical protein [Crocosphaera chwakensis]EAZ91934.1 hypothetical protein CY0110_29704 [Crocosphaera chwakensis CCY0110]
MDSKIETKIINHSSFQKIKTLIKIVSTGLISTAIIWELVNLYGTFHNWQVSKDLNWIFWIDRIALISHGIEALIAAYYTRLQQKNPLQYSIYTFFVGTVGLLELKIGQEGKE